MAVLGAILPIVSQSCNLALELYRTAASSQHETAKELILVAKSINSFASVLKQVGTIIKEDDRLPSHQAIETLEDVIEQSRSVLNQVEIASSVRIDERYEERRNVVQPVQSGQTQQASMERLAYLQAHLDALKTTLSVLLQTLYTAQSIMWSKIQPTVLPLQAANAVASERTQLETIIIEQQMSILSASRIHNQNFRASARLLMEGDSSQSLVAARRADVPTPVDLYRYQDTLIASLETSASAEPVWLPAVCRIAASQSASLLERWTSLPQFDDRVRDAERDAQAQKRETQQPMVESDSEDDSDQRRKLAGNGTRMSALPRRSGSAQPLFTEENSLPSPVRDTKYGPTAPLSPDASPRTSRDSLAAPTNAQDSPVSPRSSITSLPVEAAAAIEAKEEDDDVELEIPWTLCTRKYYWRYVDSKIVGSNTSQPPSIAFLERNSWTEIMASWVCKEAIREAGYKVTQVQKDRKDGRRTKFETCFCVEQPLQFQQVKQLVERTVEIYRQRKPATPPPRVRRSSFNRPPPPPYNVLRANEIDRDRTPVPKKALQPPLERSTSSMPFTPRMPSPLDRSISMPGPGQSGFQAGPHPRMSNLQIPMPSGPYVNPIPQSPCSPHMAQSTYAPQLYSSPQSMYPPNTVFNSSALLPHLQAPQSHTIPQSSLRQSYLNPNPKSRYDDGYTTSDSESNDREMRRQRSKSRNRSTAEKKRKSHTKSKAISALMGVGGLTALLDGLSVL